jgi:D-alanyl-D-alanine carboxypeptidase
MTWCPLAFALTLTALVAPAAAHAAPEPRAYPERDAHQLDRIAGHAGGGSGIVVADARSGAELYARHADTPRTLASNTKLFVTAAAAHRWGERVYPTLRAILEPSDNALAEALAARLGDGSRHRGVRRAERFAAGVGARVQLRDGAGLATANRATPRQMVRFLVAMRHVRGYRGWERALPVAGRSGTLAARMRGTAAEGRCHAKTGTLFVRTNASTLSGYCTTRSGRAIAFSILMATTPQNGRAVQDRLLARIARLSVRAASYADSHHSVGRRDDPVREAEAVAGASPAGSTPPGCFFGRANGVRRIPLCQDAILASRSPSNPG